MPLCGYKGAFILAIFPRVGVRVGVRVNYQRVEVRVEVRVDGRVEASTQFSLLLLESRTHFLCLYTL